MKRILAISGSTRRKSTNHNLITAIQQLFDGKVEIKLFEGISGIPHFNPDLDTDSPPENVSSFRDQIKKSDGVLICTPEYAMGVPGTLKNAIDWTVSSCEFSHKPVALITASSMGQKGHQSLLETLKIIECNISDETQLLIPFARTKIDENNKINDAIVLKQVCDLMEALILNLNHTK